MLNKEFLLQFIKETAWLGITALVAMAVLYPITLKLDYLYYSINFAFIFVALTYFRWTLTLRSLPFLKPGWVRFLLFAVNLSLFIYFMHHEQQFLMRYDIFETLAFGFPRVIMFEEVKQDLFKYLYAEMVLFATASLIMIVVFNVRLIVAWWQLYKYRANALLED